MIWNEEDTDGRARVTADEEQVLHVEKYCSTSLHAKKSSLTDAVKRDITMQNDLLKGHFTVHCQYCVELLQFATHGCPVVNLNDFSVHVNQVDHTNAVHLGQLLQSLQSIH